MLDYTLKNEDNSNFILKYEIVDNEIIIYFANGDKFPVAYTEKNEEKILVEMMKQVNDATEKVYEAKKEIKHCTCWTIVNLINVVISFILIFSGEALAILALGLATVALTGFLGKIKYQKKIIKDINKHQFFLDNEEELNKSITKQNVLTGVSKKTIKQIGKTPEEKKVFDINRIDNMSLEDLKKIRENIERNYKFNFEEEKAKVKVKS